MTAVAIRNSFSEPMVFTQSRAAGALTTWAFHLVLSADGTDATGLVPVVTISKAGAAFAGAAGVVSEISGGWYKIVFTNVDLNTLGQLAAKVAVATADTLYECHQVTLLDQNIATVPLAAGAISSATVAAGTITAATFATDAIDANALKADAVTEMQTGLATAAGVAATASAVNHRTVALGTLVGNTSSAGVSMKNAANAIVTCTGTFGGGTCTVEVCADPNAASPVWVAYPASTLTSNGSKTVTGPISAVRVTMSGSTSPSVVVTAVVATPAGAVI